LGDASRQSRKGFREPNENKVGKITMKQEEEIQDQNAGPELLRFEGCRGAGKGRLPLNVEVV
jgi:hypothetical protein